MAFCPNCGTAASGQFCPNCGTNIAAEPAGSTATPLRANAPGLTNNIASALCYVVPLICGIVFLVLDPYKNDRKVRFDAFQSIFLAIAVIVVGYILEIVLPEISWNLYWPIHSLYRLACLLLWIYLAVKAFQNAKTVLPGIGPLAEKQAAGA
ncbi:MAG: hypothetical protein M3Y07_13505 [Acidobacteriota bacterium]|nr:hypothetical protein [Acidobacteriota bacterium]